MENNSVLSSSAPSPHRFISDNEKFSLGEILTVDEMNNIMKYYHPVNRPLNKGQMDKIVRDIEDNRWEDSTGNQIRFDKYGHLIDGQHRITAHIYCNVPFKTNVLYGLPTESIKFIDKNVPRNASINPVLVDCLLNGIIPSKETFRNKRNQLATAKWWLQCYEKHKRPSDTEMQSFYEKNQVAIEFALALKDDPSSCKRPGYLSAIAIYFTKDPIKAKSFRDVVGGDGANIPAGSPILAIRNYLIKTSHGGNQTREDHFKTVCAIHAFHFGTQISILKEKKEWDF